MVHLVPPLYILGHLLIALYLLQLFVFWLVDLMLNLIDLVEGGCQGGEVGVQEVRVDQEVRPGGGGHQPGHQGSTAQLHHHPGRGHGGKYGVCNGMGYYFILYIVLHLLQPDGKVV